MSMDVDLAWTIILHAPGRNKRLTRAIINTTKQTAVTTETGAIKKLLKKIYDHITRLFKALSAHFDGDDSRPTDKLVLDTWRSFLQPIRALRKLPSCGEFVAARLLLFTGGAFLEETGLSLSYNEETLVEETNPLHGFTADLDDALLEPLKKMWELSQFRERFDWVFTRFNVNDYEMTEALALSPQELEDLDGIRGIKYYYLASDDANDADAADESDESDDESDESDDESDDDDESDEDDADELERYNLYTGPIPRWDCGEQDWDNLEWKRKGSDGPITGWLEYRIQEYELPDENFMNGFHIFRRSHQFCLDARQKSEAHIGRQQHQTFDEVARRCGLPPEMRNRILSYIEYRDPFPYLEKLDLAEAYVPFPKVGKHCTRCDNTEEESTANQTCTQKAIHVWNLALRRFHTFHMDDCHEWSLCNRHDCTGHHDDGQNWKVTEEPQFTRYLESLAARGNDEFVSLDKVGLGPMSPIRLKAEADDKREDALFRGRGIYYESSEDAKMIGGLGGLKHAMIHGHTLLAVWKGDDCHSSFHHGAKAVEPTWQYARSLYDERVAKVVIKRLHSGDDCESCIEADEEFIDFPWMAI